MSILSRRAFVVRLSGALPIALLARRAYALSVHALSAEPAPADTMRALGDVVLPSELGAAGIARVVADFQRWIAGYREHAELVHGYGTSRLRFTPPTPATRWASQLDALDADARKRLGKAFAQASVAEREQIVRDALAHERLDRMPATSEASHVAIALAAFFFESAEAGDLCYDAHIGRQTCRPLGASLAMPLERRRRAAGEGR